MWPFAKREPRVQPYREDTVELLSTDDISTRARKICQASGLALNPVMQARLPVIEQALEFYQMSDMRRSRSRKND